MGKQAGNKKSAAPKQQPNSARVAPRVDERSHQSRGESTGRRGNNDVSVTLESTFILSIRCNNPVPLSSWSFFSLLIWALIFHSAQLHRYVKSH